MSSARLLIRQRRPPASLLEGAQVSAILDGLRGRPRLERAEGLFLLSKSPQGREADLLTRLGWLKESESEATAGGALRLATRARVYRAFLRLRAGDPEVALDELKALDGLPPGLALMRDGVGGMAQHDMGDFADSIESFRRVERWASRLDDAAALARARRWLLTLYEFVGPEPEVSRRARAFGARLASQSAGCDRLRDANGLLWWSLVRRSSPTGALRSDGPLAIASAVAAAPLVAADLESCPLQRREAVMNLALNALERGSAAEGRGWLEAIEGEEVSGRDQAWLDEAWGRLFILEGRPERARRQAEKLQAHPLAPIAFAGHALAMAAAEQRDRVDVALAEARRAQAVVESWPGGSELGRGWSSLLGHLASVTQSQVRLLLRSNREKDAFRAARWGRRMALRTRWRSRLADSWKPSLADELSAVDARTLVLLTHPGPRAWWLFAATEAKVRVFRLSELSTSVRSLREALQGALHELESEIAEVETLQLLLQGMSLEVDVHGMMHRGRPLQMSKSVQYRLDGPAPSAHEEHGATLVVADPTGDLPGARASGLELARSAHARLLIGADANLAVVPGAIERAGIFYYFGHGEPAGRTGYDTGLRLAAEGYLGVDAVFALSRVPGYVFLGTCSGASEREAGPIGPRLGIAQAFVLGGARVVMASTRPVDDQLAYDLEGAARTAPSWEAALRALAAARPEADWAAFRLFTP